LESVDINVNMNEIPFDDSPPTVTSGIRIGTPAVTTRGMTQQDMVRLGDIISRALRGRDDPTVLADARDQVRELTLAFPLYPELG